MSFGLLTTNRSRVSSFRFLHLERCEMPLRCIPRRGTTGRDTIRHDTTKEYRADNEYRRGVVASSQILSRFSPSIVSRIWPLNVQERNVMSEKENASKNAAETSTQSRLRAAQERARASITVPRDS